MDHFIVVELGFNEISARRKRLEEVGALILSYFVEISSSIVNNVQRRNV